MKYQWSSIEERDGSIEVNCHGVDGRGLVVLVLSPDEAKELISTIGDILKAQAVASATNNPSDAEEKSC